MALATQKDSSHGAAPTFPAWAVPPTLASPFPHPLGIGSTAELWVEDGAGKQGPHVWPLSPTGQWAVSSWVGLCCRPL